MKLKRPYDGIPTAEEEALQPPDWDPIDSSVAFLTGGSRLAPRLAAAGTDIASQGLLNSSLPSWVSYPASLALGLSVGRMVPDDALPGGMGAKYVDAWHASPHKFDRFDSSRIGTGEGSQYRGHGLYFAENPNVSGILPDNSPSFYDRYFQKKALNSPAFANTFRDYLTWPFNSLDWQHKNIVAPMRTEGPKAETYLSSPGGNLPEQQLYRFWEERKPTIYQVRLNRPASEFLDLDKPIPRDVVNRIDPQVTEAVNNHFDYYGHVSPLEEPRHYTGWDLYKALMLDPAQESMAAEIGSGGVTSSWINSPITTAKQHVAAYLNSLGIPGARFFDAVSRRDMEPAEQAVRGTRNYVMFPGNDDSIEILKRYALPFTMLGAAAGGEQDPQ